MCRRFDSGSAQCLRVTQKWVARVVFAREFALVLDTDPTLPSGCLLARTPSIHRRKDLLLQPAADSPAAENVLKNKTSFLIEPPPPCAMMAAYF